MKHWKNFDGQLVILPLGIVAFGVMVLFAISRWPTANVSTGVPMKQALYAVMGLFFMLVLTNFDYRLLRPFALPLYVASLGLLTFVIIHGHSAYGAQRWINLGILPLQPSEPAKLALVILLAKFFSDHEHEIYQWRTVVKSLGLLFLPMALVLDQPDLGTSGVFLAIWVGMALMAGVRLKHMGMLGLVALAAMPVAWTVIGHVQRFKYTQDRLLIFLHPQQDPLGQGYNVIHSLITIGSGGLWGQWFQVGSQSQLGLLRVEDKDFIFSVISEQVGFMGVLILFAVFVLFLMRIARVSFMAAETYGRLIASGVLAMIMFEIFVNIGMNLGLMPVTGIPLPLLSYGGSSLITTLASMGILQSILLRHQKLVFASA